MLRPYQKDKEGSEILNRWHATNKKSDESVKKAKSKDNPQNSSASRRSGFSTPRTDTDFQKSIGVDDIQDLDDAPIKFEYGKDLLPGWALADCRLGLRTIYAPHHPDVFGTKGTEIFDITFDFEDIQQMFRLKEHGIEMVRLWCM